jgi:hypothetical protein
LMAKSVYLPFLDFFPTKFFSPCKLAQNFGHYGH